MNFFSENVKKNRKYPIGGVMNVIDELAEYENVPAKEIERRVIIDFESRVKAARRAGEGLLYPFLAKDKDGNLLSDEELRGMLAGYYGSRYAE